MRRARLLLVLAVSAGGLAGCGAAAQRTAVVARVGGTAITNVELAHWMAVLASQHAVPDPPRFTACLARARQLAPAARSPLATCRREYQALEQRALNTLIAARWLIDEANEEGVGVSASESQRLLGARRSQFPTARSFAESLKATDETTADVELELRAERASAKLREKLRKAEPAASAPEVAAYYRRHIRTFTHPERRTFYIVEALRSGAAARRRRREILLHRDIASIALHESMQRTGHSLSAPIVVKAIFDSRPGELVGPLEVKPRLYYLIEVDHVTPPYVQSLAQATRAIEAQLARERWRSTLARFAGAFSAKWVARTDCSAGHVVSRCRQYAGRRTVEPAPGFS